MAIKTLAAFAACLAVLAGAAVAQDLTPQSLAGQWQGTLQAGRDLRVVVQISPAPDGKSLQAMFYSIDQGPGGLAASDVTLQGAAVSLTVPGINGKYEGKLNAERTAIVGTWSQGPGNLPLTLTKASGDAAWKIPERPAALAPMPATAKPVFAAVTIKPSRPDQPGKAFAVRGRTVTTLNTTLTDLIGFAYNVHPKQITGAPAWSESDKFDINGQPDLEGAPNTEQLRGMMQKLLAERFKLSFHRDQRELAVYAIVVAPGGPKLTKSGGDPNGLPGLFFRGLGMLPVTNATITDLARTLQGAVLDRPVVDRSGITGRWDFTLNWTPDEGQFAQLGVRVPPPSGDANAPPGLFTAMQEQIGLKLDSTKAQVDVLVVDAVEKPSEN